METVMGEGGAGQGRVSKRLPLHKQDTFPFLNWCAESLQSCPTLCDPMDWRPPRASVHGILQQEYWSGLLCPPPGDLPDPGIKSVSLTSPAFAGRFFTTSPSWGALK